MRDLVNRPLLITFLSTVLSASQAWAQLSPQLSAGATMAGVRTVSFEGGVDRVSDGMVFGGRVGVRAGAFALTGNYLEGNVRASGTETDLALVEGSATASVRLNPWLQVGTTVRVHRVEEAAPERWLFWGAGARVDLPLLGSRVRGHAAYDQGIGGSVNLPYGEVSARSGEVGLTMELSGTPFAIDLASLVEQEGAGGRTRTLQHLALTLEWRGPK